MAAKILIVDDEAVIRTLLTRILKGAGYAVTDAENGVEALEKIGTERFDLVLLDIMMPALDGWGVLARLRGRADAPPVLVLSAYAEPDRALLEGAIGCIRKPFRSSDLLSNCRRALRE